MARDSMPETAGLSVVEYFDRIAHGYDAPPESVYWHRSDAQLWELLCRLLEDLPSAFNFLDAGGGTGSWSMRVLAKFPNSRGTVLDISEAMLSIGQERVSAHGLNDRLKFLRGDLNQSCPSLSQIDVIFCLHNVLGFLNYPAQSLKYLRNRLSSPGMLVMMVPSLGFGIRSALALEGRHAAQRVALIKRGRYGADMPASWYFSVDDLVSTCVSINLATRLVATFPDSQGTCIHRQAEPAKNHSKWLRPETIETIVADEICEMHADNILIASIAR